MSPQSYLEVVDSPSFVLGGVCDWQPATFSAQFLVLETFLQVTGAVLSTLSSTDTSEAS